LLEKEGKGEYIGEDEEEDPYELEKKFLKVKFSAIEGVYYGRMR
jgi:hypothetical protein